MIVGLDHDDTTIFQSQFQFLQEACIKTPTLNILSAVEGTKLWIRLLKEGRVLESPDTEKSFPYFANCSPKRMARVELLSGYLDLVEKVRDWRNFEAQVKGMVSRVQRRPLAKTGMARNREWRQIVGALKFLLFQIDCEVRGVTCRLILYTVRHAPFMAGKVA